MKKNQAGEPGPIRVQAIPDADLTASGPAAAADGAATSAVSDLVFKIELYVI
jgi:hypothetical protein